jgi:hypothetical protein
MYLAYLADVFFFSKGYLGTYFIMWKRRVYKLRK